MCGAVHPDDGRRQAASPIGAQKAGKSFRERNRARRRVGQPVDGVVEYDRRRASSRTLQLDAQRRNEGTGQRDGPRSPPEARQLFECRGEHVTLFVQDCGEHRPRGWPQGGGRQRRQAAHGCQRVAQLGVQGLPEQPHGCRKAGDGGTNQVVPHGSANCRRLEGDGVWSASAVTRCHRRAVLPIDDDDWQPRPLPRQYPERACRILCRHQPQVRRQRRCRPFARNEMQATVAFQ